VSHSGHTVSGMEGERADGHALFATSSPAPFYMRHCRAGPLRDSSAP
jgi:hypothetical protein